MLYLFDHIMNLTLLPSPQSVRRIRCHLSPFHHLVNFKARLCHFCSNQGQKMKQYVDVAQAVVKSANKQVCQHWSPQASGPTKKKPLSVLN